MWAPINYALQIVAAPSAFMVASDLADQLRIADDDLQSGLIDDYIAAAVETIEIQTRHVFNPTQYTYALDRWPYNQAGGFVTAGYPTNGILELPRAPLSTVDVIQYTDTLGTVQTLDPSAYIVDNRRRPGRVWPARFTYWPIADVVSPNSVIVTFTAGYTNAALVPRRAKQAVRFLVAHWFKERVPVAEASKQEVPKTLTTLIRSLKI